MSVIQHHSSTSDHEVRPRRPFRRVQLPGVVRSSTGLSWFESLVFVAVVPLLSLPVLLATMGAGWAAVAALALTVGATWLCAIRRVTIGTDWIADRRLLHYRVTSAVDVRRVELIENGHGGVLRIHRHDGRPHRLRQPEFDTDEARAALADFIAAGRPVVDHHVRTRLELPTAAATGAAALTS